MDDTERLAMALAAIDATIAMLTIQRDLLAVSIMEGISTPLQAPPVVDGECQHLTKVPVTTMGAEESAFMCVDCEAIL